jgi:hypothetical protein
MINPKPTKSAKIPVKVIKEMEANGASVQKLESEGLYGVTNITYKDRSWDSYAAWGEKIDSDPNVMSAFFPSPEITGTTLCPALDLGAYIQREANSVIYHYAPLGMEAFANDAVPVIGAPLPAPPLFIPVHHSTVALSKLMERIQRPPQDYMTIHSLSPGSYICHIVQHWANATVSIALFKP